MGRHRLVDGGLPFGLVRHIEMHVGRRAAGLLDLGDDGLAVLVEHVGHDDGLGALAGERRAVAAPMPLAAPVTSATLSFILMYTSSRRA